MFSGLVREIAKVISLDGSILRLRAKYIPEIGDSIAVNGACLTVIDIFKDGFALELSAHTKELLAIERLKDSVHIEPALRADSRLDGHFVQGHIDFIGVITDIKVFKNQTHFLIQAPKKAITLCIPKGSICIDGISLTIADVKEDSFELILIPHTMQNTLFGSYKVGMKVHIETDMIVRSIAHMLNKHSPLDQQNNLEWQINDMLMSY